MRRVAAIIAGVLLSLFGMTGAQAHAELTGFALEGGGASDVVRLTFSETVASLGTTVVVLDPNDRAVEAGDAEIDGSVVSVVLLPLTIAGDYVINYRVLAEDGHVVSGSRRFAVTAADLAQERGAYPVLTASPETSAVTVTDPTLAYWITAFLMLGGMLAAMIAWRAKR